LSEEQILFLAQWLPDFRSIHSALSRLALSGEFQGGTFRTKQLQELVQADEETPEKPPDCEFILEKTAAYFRLEPGDLKSSRRSSSVVLARQCAMYLCRCLSNSSYDAIGQAFGGKNHATVIYAFKKIQQLQKDKKKVKNMLEELSTICRNR
jgi:chromosomal replication initiator protein